MDKFIYQIEIKFSQGRIWHPMTKCFLCRKDAKKFSEEYNDSSVDTTRVVKYGPLNK